MHLTRKQRLRGNNTTIPTNYYTFQCTFFLLKLNKNRLTRKEFPSDKENTENNKRIGECPTVPSEEFLEVNDDDDVCTASIMADEDILKIVQSSKYVINAHSDDQN
ncbi:hypothetical protein TNCV_4634251 [Trichonephila clavipes]|nr:hypothetical protein TNCV_4634251 [Trichonephila clavipes]